MRRAAISSLIAIDLLLCSCQKGVVPVSPLPAPLVYEGEYVIEARGEWCPWAPGVRECPIVYNSGTYSVTDRGRVKLIKPEIQPYGAGKITPYNPDKDLCLTEFKGEDCSPNYAVQIDVIPNDPQYPNMWGLKDIRAAEAWETKKEGTVPIAVIDTGVWCDHPDLKGSCIKEFNALTGEKTNGAANDTNGHGTHVAGTICARGNNANGVTGVLWGCQIIAAKFIGSNGYGGVFDAITAIDYAVQQGARIINASWGGSGYSQPLYNAIKRARDANVLFVAAAGNNGVNTDDTKHYPSSYELDNIISVAAINKDAKKTSFSNYGRETVDIAAPGDAIYSTWILPDQYKSISGTSMSAPHVSGVLGATGNRDSLLGNGRGEPDLEDKVKTGSTLDFVGALTGTKPCNEKKLKACKEECNDKFPCACGKQQTCKDKCKEKWC